MVIPFRPVIVTDNILLVVEDSDPLVVRANLGDAFSVTTLKVIVRDKLKIVEDVPDLPRTSEVQCAKWLKVLNPDLDVLVGPLDAIIEFLSHPTGPASSRLRALA